MKRKRNPVGGLDAAATAETLKVSLTMFPFVHAYVSTLGGAERASVMLTVSLEPRSEWQNGILENSNYAKFHIDYTGSVEMISGYGVGKMRKSKVKTALQAAEKIKTFLHSGRKSNPRPRAPKRKKNPTGKAHKYYIVEQAQGGHWKQVGYFFFKPRATALLNSLKKNKLKVRVLHTWLAGTHNHKPK